MKLRLTRWIATAASGPAATAALGNPPVATHRHTKKKHSN